MPKSAFQALHRLQLLVSAMVTSRFSAFICQRKCVAIQTFRCVTAFSTKGGAEVSPTVRGRRSLLFHVRSIFSRFLRLLARSKSISVLRFFARICYVRDYRLLRVKAILRLMGLVFAGSYPMRNLRKQDYTSGRCANVFCFYPISYRFSYVVT